MLRGKNNRMENIRIWIYYNTTIKIIEAFIDIYVEKHGGQLERGIKTKNKKRF